MVAFVLPCRGGQFVVLASGFRLHADRVEWRQDKVFLHQGDSALEFPASLVTSVEEEEYVPPPEPQSEPVLQAPMDAGQLLREAALRHGLPPEFVLSVAAVESGLRQQARSPKGAVGLMQLMPSTARELKADPTDPVQNADAGARYLRWLLIKYLDDPYQVRKALAAYNAGPAAVDRFGGVPPYQETQRFVQRVLDQHRRLSHR